MSNTQRDELVDILHCNPFPYGGAGAYMRPDANASHAMANAILAAGYRKPRTITTVEELDATRPGGMLLCSGDRTGEGDGNTVFRWTFSRTANQWNLTDGILTYVHTPSVLEDYSSVVPWEPEAEVGA